jgi:hypothetical protein
MLETSWWRVGCALRLREYMRGARASRGYVCGCCWHGVCRVVGWVQRGGDAWRTEEGLRVGLLT